MKTEDTVELDGLFDGDEVGCDGEEVLILMNGGNLDLIVAADAMESWTAYTLHANSIENGEMSAIVDDAGKVIGVECPECGLNLLFEWVYYSNQVWETGWNAYLQCDDSETVVFVSDKARKKYGIPDSE